MLPEGNGVKKTELQPIMSEVGCQQHQHRLLEYEVLYFSYIINIVLQIKVCDRGFSTVISSWIKCNLAMLDVLCSLDSIDTLIAAANFLDVWTADVSTDLTPVCWNRGRTPCIVSMRQQVTGGAFGPGERDGN